MIAFVSTDVEMGRMMARLRMGEVRALARAVSLVEDGGVAGKEVVAACRLEGKRALRIGVTGPPGAGKSTLVDQMVRWLRKEGKTVGVIAVDPSSPFTGGALLGDRIRMQGALTQGGGDDGVYIRSMASRGRLGGLARGAEDVCAVMEAAGREVVLIETVGVGQDEVEVAGLADVTVLVLVPGMGDEVQSLKAGVMEVADVFVVNKGDREGAERLEAEILSVLSLSGSEVEAVPVLRTVSTSGEGVGRLMEVVAGLRGQQRRRMTNPTSDVKLSDPSTGSGQAMGHPVGVGLRLDHLGVAVRSIAAARGFYESLGLVVEDEEVVDQEQVRVAMLPLGETRVELLEATAEASVVGRFVARRGEGLHHIAVRVGDVDGMFARLAGEGVRLASDAVRVGAGGHRYFFVHPSSAGGVLVEIVGAGAAGGTA